MSRADIERLVERLEAVTFPLKTGIRYGTEGERVFGDSADVVRSLLYALREPSEEMVRAATPILGNGLASRAVKEFNAEGSTRVWQAMIDHLLAD